MREFGSYGQVNFYLFVVLRLLNTEKEDGQYRTFEGRPELAADTCSG